LQERNSSLFPQVYAQVSSGALTQVSASNCPREGRNRFGDRD